MCLLFKLNTVQTKWCHKYLANKHFVRRFSGDCPDVYSLMLAHIRAEYLAWILVHYYRNFYSMTIKIGDRYMEVILTMVIGALLITSNCFLELIYLDVLVVASMMTSSKGYISRVTGPLCGEFAGHRWITRTKTSDAELWCFLDLRLNKRLSKQSWGWWFETPSRTS